MYRTGAPPEMGLAQPYNLDLDLDRGPRREDSGRRDSGSSACTPSA